jgi:hypothetical protein
MSARRTSTTTTSRPRRDSGPEHLPDLAPGRRQDAAATYGRDVTVNPDCQREERSGARRQGHVASRVLTGIAVPFSLPSPDIFADCLYETAFPAGRPPQRARPGCLAEGSSYGHLRETSSLGVAFRHEHEYREERNERITRYPTRELALVGGRGSCVRL